jgi:hypothetical protein
LVVQQKVDYVFSVKKNPDLQYAETLYEDVREYFKDLAFSVPVGKNRHIRFQYGRIEDRDYTVGEDVCGAGGTASRPEDDTEHRGGGVKTGGEG